MNQRQRENFAKLIGFVIRIPDKHFDFKYITFSRNPRLLDAEGRVTDFKTVVCQLKRIGKEFTAGDCGAVGCVMGFCPAFFPRSFEYNSTGHVVLKNNKDRWDKDAMAEFFGISYDEAEYLFYPHRYLEYDVGVPKRAVITRMKQFLRKKEKEANAV